MECKYITELGSLCGLGCTDAIGHCWRHVNKIEEAEACYTLIVANGMPKPLLGNEVGMPKLTTKTARVPDVINGGTMFSPGEE